MDDIEKHHVRGLVFSPAAKRLAVTIDERGDERSAAVAVVDITTGRALFLHRGLPDIGAVAFSPDGGRVAYTVKNGVRIADTFTGEDRAGAGRFYDVVGATLSPRGDRAIVSSPDHLTVWDTGDCSRVADFAGQKPLADVLAVPGGGAVIGFGRDSMDRVDLRTGGVGRRFQVPGASQSYVGAVLEKGRVLVVNDDWREAATGRELPRAVHTLLAVSDDQRTAVWSDEGGPFLWPVDSPIPAKPPVLPFSGGRPSVGERALLSCGDQSCLVVRAPSP